ncbi:hypothetical protein D5086_012313 [Populus alba]|uniref:Uncharacterized protein n=1 Tax=Populus alba TaxID=43335 RepID=A0ACC4C2I1_POPAL
MLFSCIQSADGEGIRFNFPSSANPNVEKYSTASVSLECKPTLTTNQATCQGGFPLPSFFCLNSDFLTVIIMEYRDPMSAKND